MSRGWDEVQRVYHAALERPESERGSFLLAACGSDTALRADVQSLLEHEVRAELLFEATAMGVSAQAIAADGRDPAGSLPPDIHGYDVLSLLGAGGMGEVYRARDRTLGREVALKVLPAFVSGDPDRLARFAREARVLATLNHPHVGAIHGVAEGRGGIGALVLELVEGDTVAERIARGPVPVNEALSIARQIAEALEAAHERGIIHRDLKPANVKITGSGIVKVLDFGLAKTATDTAPGAEARGTLTIDETRKGMVLGTAAYMSPEQARGHSIDKRADIWAFGCVVFEMLSGRAAFARSTVADTFAAILGTDPDWGALPSALDARIRSLLRRCLQKDVRRRLHDIGDARLELEDIDADSMQLSPAGVATVSAPGPAVHRKKTAVRALLLALVLLSMAGAAGIATMISRRADSGNRQLYRSSLIPPEDTNWSSAIPAIRFALSPDGRKLAFVATGRDGRVLLWVRSLDALAARPLAGTEGATMPFWSPNSRFIGFNAGGKLKTIDASGGPPVVVTDTTTNNNAAWSPGGVIVFLPKAPGPFFRISAAGGSPSPLTTLDAESGDYQHWNPFFLPDGRHFLYFAVGSKVGGPLDARAVYVGSLDPAEPRRLVLQGGSNAKYAQGYLLFMRDRTLMAQRFDPNRMELSGEPAPLAEGVEVGGTTGRTGAFSVSQTGVLAYQTQPVSPGLRSQLIWFDRAGKLISRLEDPVEYQDITLSPDGTRAAVSLVDSVRRARDIWIFDVAGGTRTRLTFDPFDELSSIWSPDGRRVIFSSSRSQPFDLYQKEANGSGAEIKLLADKIANKSPMSWSPDSRFVLYTYANASNNLWALPLFGDRRTFQVLESEGEIQSAQFSPDGRWIAYSSNDSGRFEVYVVPFSPGVSVSATPGPAGKWQVSPAGGTWPRWRGDGRELFYLAPNDTLMAAIVTGHDADLDVGGVQRLFPTRPRASQGIYAAYNYDVSRDGQHFLVNTLVDQAPPSPITLVFNWTAALTK